MAAIKILPIAILINLYSIFHPLYTFIHWILIDVHRIYTESCLQVFRKDMEYFYDVLAS